VEPLEIESFASFLQVDGSVHVNHRTSCGLLVDVAALRKFGASRLCPKVRSFVKLEIPLHKSKRFQKTGKSLQNIHIHSIGFIKRLFWNHDFILAWKFAGDILLK